MNVNAPAFVSVDSQYADVSALLNIIANPATHKARLDELIAQEKATHERIAAHDELMAKTRGMHSAAEAAMIVATNRKTALDAREAELDTRSQALELTEATRSHKALQGREAAVQAREEAVEREEKRLATVRTDLEGKRASIQGLADTLRP